MIKDRGFVGKYTIFDFPEMVRIQKHYLSKHPDVRYESDSSNLPTPSANSLFIAMSSLEESPKDIQKIFFDYAKSYDLFFFKYSGGKNSFDNFANEIGGAWKCDPTLTRSCCVHVGCLKKV